ncbi:MAG: bifunctional (p)ppGpp synthetase/guanosine-3',5'-bis(diphosphate) 3'-pyrophosphohydrolase [Deltaproteobacteria bacterium]|nr:bifunctional (p)ppGpp synthetase/guanosine-3',5'-bis(diphosphate) 3'-pyrophosphohydrolase [Deltaproteobacteria bacterium]
MIRITDILDKVRAFLPADDLARIMKAHVYAATVHRGQMRLSGEPYLSHPTAVANILAEMKMDGSSIVAGLLHDTIEDTHTTLEDIENNFGKDVAFLVDGLTKLSKIAFSNKEERQAENFRKMVLAMSADIRILLVRLADRVHNMQTLDYHASEEKRQEIARETLELYAPLANRLGIYWMKVELENMAFSHLNPQAYNALYANVFSKVKEREVFTAGVKEIIAQEMEDAGIAAEVEGRAKHIFSIFSKMQRQRVSFDEIYDLIAFRIILEENNKTMCYATLSIIHARWKPVQGRFKDYIAMPKANKYQSLHTTVIGPNGERIEIQIRTREMHEWAERGIAAHWLYKEEDKQAGDSNKQIEKIRELLEMQQEIDSPREYMSHLKMALFSDDVYVFTPAGDVKEFPKDATPIDFAYAVHTNVGDKCVGARVNGKMVPLRYKLQNGDTVEIITQAVHQPSRDWLKIVVTSRAKSKIKAWIREEDKKRTIELGRDALEKELGKNQEKLSSFLKSEKFSEIIKANSLENTDALFAIIGKGKLSPKSVVNRYLDREEERHEANAKTSSKRKDAAKHDTARVSAAGVDNMMVRFAKCCDPIPGDKIYGFISRGRGIVAHTRTCPHVANVEDDRLIELKWTTKEKEVYPVHMRVICRDRKGVLADVSSAITSQDANIAHAQVKTENKDMEAICTFKIDVHDLEHYRKVVGAVNKLTCVLSVERLRGR